jgi:aspartate 1-decarboxylase
MRKVVAGKLHGIHVMEANLNYHGSITLDPSHCEEVGFLPMEFVKIWNRNSGARISIYLILGERGSRCCILNRAAARTCQPGDAMIICNSVYIPKARSARSRQGSTFGRDNHVAERLRYQSSRDEQGRYRFSILDEAGVSRQIPLHTEVGLSGSHRV